MCLPVRSRLVARLPHSSWGANGWGNARVIQLSGQFVSVPHKGPLLLDGVSRRRPVQQGAAQTLWHMSVWPLNMCRVRACALQYNAATASVTATARISCGAVLPRPGYPFGSLHRAESHGVSLSIPSVSWGSLPQPRLVCHLQLQPIRASDVTRLDWACSMTALATKPQGRSIAAQYMLCV